MIDHSTLMNTYNRSDVYFVRGQGCWLTDNHGQVYLDALSGVAVNTLGHTHPKFVAALTDQLGQLMHVSNLYRIQEQEKAASLLCQYANMTNAFFCNSGCEANEAAIKLARLHAYAKHIRDPQIIVMEGAFHGRTLGTLSASVNLKNKTPFAPLLSGFQVVPFNDPERIRAIAHNNNNVVAVLFEALQGEGGINLADKTTLQQIRQLCDANGWLMICDEVQCGTGRTGQWFAYQESGVLPDVVTLAKGLGSGLPVGACLARGSAADLFQPGLHGSTFGGNPLAMRAVLTTLSLIENENLLNNAKHQGQRIVAALHRQLANNKAIVEIRGQGLMIGVQFAEPCTHLVATAMEHGLLINVTNQNVLRLLPPLIINDQETSELISRLIATINA